MHLLGPVSSWSLPVILEISLLAVPPSWRTPPPRTDLEHEGWWRVDNGHFRFVLKTRLKWTSSLTAPFVNKSLVAIWFAYSEHPSCILLWPLSCAITWGACKIGSYTPELFVNSKYPVLFVSDSEQKINRVADPLVGDWVFRDMGTGSQLKLVLGSDCWEVDPAVLALLGGCELNLEAYPHFRFPPTLQLSVVQ